MGFSAATRGHINRLGSSVTGADMVAKPRRTVHHRTAIGQVQREKTRAWIIKSAIPVFAEHGPDIPVIDDFVKAAGVSRGTFYNYFQTTRELLDAAMASLSDEVIASIVPAVAGMPDPLMRLATAARIYYRKATMDPLFGAFLESVSGVGTLAIERARGDLQEAMNAGQLGVKDIDLAQAIAVGVMVFALKTPTARAGGDARGVEVVRAILAGLGVAKPLIQRALSAPLPEGLPAA
jgi:AcrR family transcriptional regulator